MSGTSESSRDPTTSSVLLPGGPELISATEGHLCQSFASAQDSPPPISKLPPELLLAIFECAIEVDCPDHVGHNGPEADIDSIFDDNLVWDKLKTITHVCSTWRATAINCHSLWSAITLTNGRRVAEEMLSRSEGAPLIIRTRTIENLSPSFLQRLLNIERIQKLHTRLQIRDPSHLFDMISGTSAPHLRSLVIHDIYLRDHRYEIPQSLFSIPMPLLQNLHIDRCVVPWRSLHSCVSPQLLSLTLSYTSRPTRDEFYELLSMIPNLKTLCLAETLPPTTDKDVAVFTVELPKLSSCTMVSSIAQCMDFHTYVRYPTYTADFAITTSEIEENPPSSVEAVEALISSWGLSCVNPLRTHTHMEFHMHDLRLRGRKKRARIMLGNALPDASPLDFQPSFKIDLTTTRPHNPSWLNMLMISGLNVAVFSMHGRMMDYDANEWFGFFKRHAGITHLHLSSWEGSTKIIPAIATSAARGRVLEGNDDDGEILDGETFLPCFPGLVELTLEVTGPILSRKKIRLRPAAHSADLQKAP